MIKKTSFAPEYASAPGETLVETLGRLGMTQAELAERTGRPKKTINEIIQGKAALTPDTAIQLERVLGIPASFWNNLERNYREVLARQNERARLVEQVEWCRKYPAKKMASLGWIKHADGAVEQLAALLNFFGLASPRQDTVIQAQMGTAFRRSLAFKSNAGAVAAWLRKGELGAQHVHCSAFNAKRFESNIQLMRELTVAPPSVFSPKIHQLCAEAGVALVLVPELPGTCLCGASRWLAPTKALVQLSARYKTDDQFWFTFFHECGHLLKHGRKIIYLDEQRATHLDAIEREANQFAGDLLIPPVKYQTFLKRADYSVPAVQTFSREIDIAPGIVVGRLQHDKKLRWNAAAHVALKQRFELVND